jgi:hypothetical protein
MEFNTDTIEQHVQHQDVSDQVLRIAIEAHRKKHEKKGEHHHVEIRKREDAFSDEEEQVIKEIKKQDKIKSEAYRMATAESAGGNYAMATADGSSTYSHAHASEGSCSCGEIITADQAMRSTFNASEDKPNDKYTGSSGGSGKYNPKDNTLEGMTNYNAGAGAVPQYK